MRPGAHLTLTRAARPCSIPFLPAPSSQFSQAISACSAIPCPQTAMQHSAYGCGTACTTLSPSRTGCLPPGTAQQPFPGFHRHPPSCHRGHCTPAAHPGTGITGTKKAPRTVRGAFFCVSRRKLATRPAPCLGALRSWRWRARGTSTQGGGFPGRNRRARPVFRRKPDTAPGCNFW